MPKTKCVAILATVVFLGAASAQAQAPKASGLEGALELYKNKNFESAALGFFEVLQNDQNPESRDQAEIYLAESLLKLDLLLPALFYYTDLFKAGRGNRYYLNAVEGLLKVQQALHDPLWVPSLINEFLDPEGFGQLDPDKIAQINYLVGELSFRQRKDQDAKLFLEYVPPESPLHPKALYLLGILALRVNANDEATGHFKAILDKIDPQDKKPELARVRHMALTALARHLYGQGKFAEATKFYREVPRFSDEWFTALYENAWSYFRQEEYGKALGELQSVAAPYFAKRHVPEAWVIRGTTYFANCQWDRVRRSVSEYKAVYEPSLSELKSYLESSREPAAIYQDVVLGGNRQFSEEIAREVRRATRFKDYHFMLTHMDWEQKAVENVAAWRGTRLAQDIGVIISQHRTETERAVGKWAKRQVQELYAKLENFQAQINILDFEVADAERKWLEQGREVLKGRRVRLPRPDIPNDQWQHWSFSKEYWKDELGFIQHSLRSECF